MDLEFQPGSPERLTGEFGGEDRLLGRAHAGGVRQDEVLLRVERGEDAVVLGAEAHALDRHRHHLGAGSVEHGAELRGGGVLARAREEARSEGAVGDTERRHRSLHNPRLLGVVQPSPRET